MNRYPWIDHLKALGIFLVVAGHTALPDSTHRWIYAFHMPLFFLISGFLMSPGGFDVSLRDFFVRRVWKLVKLYFVFGLLGVAMYCYVFKNDFSLSDALRGRALSWIYASGSKNGSEDLYPLVLWFFPGLISGLLIAFGLWKIPPGVWRIPGFLGVFAAGFLMQDMALPWEIESACIAAGFLGLGHAIRIRAWDGILQVAGNKWVPLALVALSVGSFLAVSNQNAMDIRAAEIGNPFLAVPACLLLIFSLSVLCMRLPASKIAAAVAGATIWIFPTHTLAFPYVDRLAAKFAPMRDALAAGDAWYGWTKALLILAATAMTHVLSVRLSAWIGKRKAAEKQA